MLVFTMKRPLIDTNIVIAAVIIQLAEISVNLFCVLHAHDEDNDFTVFIHSFSATCVR